MSRIDTEQLPSSIRAFLDEGGDLATLDEQTFLWWLAETVVSDRRREGFASLAKSPDMEESGEADRAELLASAKASGKLAELEAMLREQDRFRGWAVELAADESLCDRVEAALPPAMVAGMIEDIEAETRPYRLVAEHRDSYVCTVTGEQRTGRAIVVRAHGPWVKEVGLFEAPDLIFSPEAVAAVLHEEAAR